MPQASSSGTFLLGVGGQKCGTSWLKWYLDSFPNVRAGFTKEYHVWDALTVPACHNYLIGRHNAFARKTWQRRRPWSRWRMQRNPEVYFDYFAGRLRRPGEMTYDITPSYSGLDHATLARIRGGFEARGVRTKAVFLIRDPFERCWSAVRMLKRNQNVAEDDAALLAERYRREGTRLRTRYDKTIRALEAAFPAEEIYVGVFETMFTPENLARLSDFLGVRARTGLASRAVNRTVRTDGVPADLKRDVIRFYGEVYEFCLARYPETRAHWNNPADFA